MSPFRFAGQWALLPVIAAASVAIGGMLGVLDGWVTTDQSAVEPWIKALLQSPLLVILATALIGMATNSWTIATMTGALAMVSAEFADEVAHWYWFDGYHLAADELVLRLPIALLAGGALGLGGCVWHHESGYTRSIGAAVLAGALGWVCWQDLAGDDWPRDKLHLAGWIAGALVVLIIARCRGIGQIAVALLGMVVVAVGIDIVHAGGAFDFGSILTTFRDQWDQFRNLVRSGS